MLFKSDGAISVILGPSSLFMTSNVCVFIESAYFVIVKLKVYFAEVILFEDIHNFLDSC